MSTHARHVTRASLRWIPRIAVWLLAAAVLLAVIVVIVLPRATQGFAMTVLTGSMAPGIPVGAVVLVRPVDPNTLEVGDIATYRPTDAPAHARITHRVIEIDESGSERKFVFKGDANGERDFKPVPAEDVVGEVWFHVPYLGSVRDALHGKAGLSLLAMIVLGIYTLTQLGGAFGETRRSRGLHTSRAASEGAQRRGLERTTIVATLPCVPGECVEDTARRWGGIVLSVHEDRVTLLLAPAPHALYSLLELLDDHAAADVALWRASSLVSNDVHACAATPIHESRRGARHSS